MSRVALCLSIGLSAFACARGDPAPVPTLAGPVELDSKAPIPSATSSVAASAPEPACRKLMPVQRIPGPPPDRPYAGVPMPGLAPGLPADAPAALVKTCRRLEAANLRAEKTIPRRKGAAKPGAPRSTGRCFAAPKTRGAWLVDVTPLPTRRENGLSFHAAEWWLSYVAPDGKTHRNAVAHNVVYTMDGEWGEQIGVLGVGDLDADGVAELLLGDGRHEVNELVVEAAVAFTFRDDEIGPFRVDLKHRGWLDVDADGRVDLLLPPRPGLSLFGVAHALPDGRFVLDDDVARAAIAQSCPAAPRGPLRNEREVGCALVWGASLESVRSRIDDGKPGPGCKAALVDVVDAAPEPPLLVGICESEGPTPAKSAAEGGGRSACP